MTVVYRRIRATKETYGYGLDEFVKIESQIFSQAYGLDKRANNATLGISNMSKSSERPYSSS